MKLFCKGTFLYRIVPIVKLNIPSVSALHRLGIIFHQQSLDLLIFITRKQSFVWDIHPLLAHGNSIARYKSLPPPLN